MKGHSDLIHAFHRASAAHSGLHLLVVGEGVLRSRLEAQADRLGISPRTHFLGWRDDIAELLGAADIFLLSSHNEGLGLVLVEAMAKRLPVVATAVGGIPEVVVHGKTGLLVPSRSPGRMAEELLKLAGDPERRQWMGAAGYRRSLARFSIDITVRRTEQVYSELTGTKP